LISCRIAHRIECNTETKLFTHREVRHPQKSNFYWKYGRMDKKASAAECVNARVFSTSMRDATGAVSRVQS
jgi:hypothetical protein